MNNAVDESDILQATLVAEAEARAGAHPGLEELARYHDGTLEGEAEDRLRDHLVGCRRCAGQLLEMQPLMQPDAGAGEDVADLEIESAWRRFQAVAAAAEAPARVAAHRSWAMAAAASLAVAALGLGLWAGRLQQVNTDLRQQIEEVSRPVVNVPTFYLGETTRGSEASENEIAVPPTAGSFVLLFPVLEAEPAAEYRLRFVDEARGDVVLESPGLVISESGNLQLGLPRGALPAGEYVIVRSALAGGGWQPVQEYRRRISYPVGPAKPTGVARPVPAD